MMTALVKFLPLSLISLAKFPVICGWGRLLAWDSYRYERGRQTKGERRKLARVNTSDDRIGQISSPLAHLIGFKNLIICG